MRVVAIDHSGAAGLEALEDLRLGVGDRFDIRKCARWTASTVVTIATCGRHHASPADVISPAWFMPISKMPKRASAGMRASVSGTPQWLLNDFSAACVVSEPRRHVRAAPPWCWSCRRCR